MLWHMRILSPKALETYWGNDTVRLALPEGDVAVGLNDDVAGLAGRLGPHDPLHAPEHIRLVRA